MIADSTGHIRFLSEELKILFWLKLSKLSPLCNVSVSACEPEDMGEEAEGEESTLDPQPFIAPSFTTSTLLQKNNVCSKIRTRNLSPPKHDQITLIF